MKNPAFRLALASAVLALLAIVPAFAASDEPVERSWNSTLIDPGQRMWQIAQAKSTPGTTLTIYQSLGSSASGMKARLDRPGLPPAIQQLQASSAYLPAADGSAAGGVVGAWYDEATRQVRTVEVRPGEDQLGHFSGAPASGSDYSYGRPVVDVSEAGDAVVVYLAEDRSGFMNLMSRFRPAGEDFGPPQLLLGPSRSREFVARDVEIGYDGTVVVAAAVERRPTIITRRPNGAVDPPETLPGDLFEHSWNSPKIGIDAEGDVVAAWLAVEGDSGNVMMSFKPPGGAFGEAQETGLTANNGGHIEMGVSRIGEVVMVAESASDFEPGGYTIQGLWGLTGNAITGQTGKPRALTGIWGSYHSFAMNPRGDAVMAWEECCPMRLRARRRAPFSGFGATVEIQEPIYFEGGRGGIVVRSAAIDDYGNAVVAWEDYELGTHTLSWDGPLITEKPADPGPLGRWIPPVALVDPPTEPVQPWETYQSPAVPGPVPSDPGQPSRDFTAPQIRAEVKLVWAKRKPALRVVVGCGEACILSMHGKIGDGVVPQQYAQTSGSSARSFRLPVPRSAMANRRAGRVVIPVRLSLFAADPSGNQRRRLIQRQIAARVPASYSRR